MKSVFYITFCALLLLWGSSCHVTQYALAPHGRLIDSLSAYRNDSLGVCFYFDGYRTQYGFIPLDRYANKPPSYLKTAALPEDDRAYQEYPLLDDADYFTLRKYLGERGLLLKLKDLKQLYPPEQIDSLRRTKFIRKVQTFPRQKLLIVEDLLPYRGHYISMIYVTKRYKSPHKLHSWRGGSVFYDPTTPDRLMSRSEDCYYDFDLRMTRENGRRLALDVDLDFLCRLKGVLDY